MCNLCYIQVSAKNFKKIKDIIEKINIDEDLKYGFNVCPFFEVEQIKEDELKLTCGGKCSGHEKEILENIGDINIKIISQKIDMDNEMFYLYYYLKNNDIKKLLKEIVMNRRHKHVSIYFLVQTYFSIEKDIRKLFSNLFIFKVSKHELNTIYDELIEHKREYVDEIIKLVYDKPYNFMFINTDTQRIFKNFDELIIED